MILHVERVVQMKLFPNSLDVLRCVSVLFADHGGERVSGRQGKNRKDNQRDPQERWEDQKQSSAACKLTPMYPNNCLDWIGGYRRRVRP